MGQCVQTEQRTQYETSHSTSLVHTHISVVPGRATILKSLLALDEDRKRKPGMTRRENVIDAGITYEARQ